MSGMFPGGDKFTVTWSSKNGFQITNPGRGGYKPTWVKPSGPYKYKSRKELWKRLDPAKKRPKPKVAEVPKQPTFYNHNQHGSFGKLPKVGTRLNPLLAFKKFRLPGWPGLVKQAAELMIDHYYFQPGQDEQYIPQPGWIEHYDCPSISQPYPYGGGFRRTNTFGTPIPNSLKCAQNQVPESQVVHPTGDCMIVGPLTIVQTRMAYDQIWRYPRGTGLPPAPLPTIVPATPDVTYTAPGDNIPKVPYKWIPLEPKYPPSERGPKGPPADLEPKIVERTPQRKEKKLILTPAAKSLAGKFINLTTETEDAVNAVYQALPEKLQKPNLTPQAKIALIYKHWRSINAKQALQNLLKQQIEDRVFGGFGRLVTTGQQKAYKNGYLGRGNLGTGPAM